MILRVLMTTILTKKYLGERFVVLRAISFFFTETNLCNTWHRLQERTIIHATKNTRIVLKNNNAVVCA